MRFARSASPPEHVAASAQLFDGQTLTIAATGGCTATSITSVRHQRCRQNPERLNAELATNNLQASINSQARSPSRPPTRRPPRRSARSAARPLRRTPSIAAVGLRCDPQRTRANLVTQYNGILQQITTTSQDASFNGVNLLNGDNLKLTFNETGKSTLNIQGVTFNAAGLGLCALTSGTDFLDNTSANSVI